ncbi:Biopolymer transport protein ExbB [Gemmata sp. SH-PL17]|uniref:MotA/TolQ/ExbB proton channel family protein n=1 Tax=Gemmata sp. SH-PL17 TaxID=1630693 RepID=UPI0004B15D0C|nr:MotA/TolQ/ExbB proton channel family protein [Gemmata sp. SH-PL17]AMV30237.1 Biopolymer transport protein ExbB [Gemmata sp. SH-PL17]
MIRSSSRFHSAGRFLCTAALAVVVLMMFSNVAHAQESPPPAEKLSGGELIWFMIRSLGFVFGPLLLAISVAMMALVVLLFLDLRMSSAIPPGFVDEFTDTVNKRKFKEAFDMARSDPSFLGQVLTAGMSRLQYGLEDAREAAMNTLESIKSDKEQKNNYNAVIATVGPMLGLVGTVYGMIESFSVLAKAKGGVNPSQLADGISHALVVTLFGVAVSVPAIFFNAFYRNRITRVTMDVGHIADDLLTQMYHNSKKAAGAPAAPAPAPGAAPTPPAPPAR